MELICQLPLTALGRVSLYRTTNAAIISYTSRIAQRVPTIEAFFVSVGRENQSFVGQLEVRSLGLEGHWGRHKDHWGRRSAAKGRHTVITSAVT